MWRYLVYCSCIQLCFSIYKKTCLHTSPMKTVCSFFSRMFFQHWSAEPWEEKDDKQRVKDLEKGSSQHSSSCLTQVDQPSGGISSPAAALCPREAAEFGRKSNITASDSFNTKPPPNPPPISPCYCLFTYHQPLDLCRQPTPVRMLHLDVIHCGNGVKLPWGSVPFISLILFGLNNNEPFSVQRVFTVWEHTVTERQKLKP